MTLHSEASDGAILNYLAGTTDAASSGALRRIAALVAAMQGAGSPEGVLTAAVGSLYTDTTNGVLYIKATGTGNTGWTDVGDAADLSLKANLAGPTFTGTVTLPSTTSIGNVSSTELGYLDGVTSAIQTQIGTKVTTPTWTSYTPSWTATGGSVAVGSGSGALAGAYIKQGELCHVRINCNMGTTPTVAGTTLWKWALPFACDGDLTGTAMFYDADGSLSMGFAQRTNGGSTVYAMTDASAYVGASAPFTWANNDYITITATYRVAA